MSSEQTAAMMEQLRSTCQALARMQQELANQAMTARQQHQETLQQTLSTAKHTNELAQKLRANQQVGPVEIQSTFHQAVDPKFSTFRSKCMTIAEWIQEIDKRAALHNLTEPNKVMYAKLAMPSQKGHLHDVKPTTTWYDFKKLVTKHLNDDMLNMIYYVQFKIFVCMDTTCNDM